MLLLFLLFALYIIYYNNVLLNFLAYQVGFEPTTFGFGIHRSTIGATDIFLIIFLLIIFISCS